MPKPHGTLGETKLKILSIIQYNDIRGRAAYGYQIWTILRDRFHCYLDFQNVSNVYRHLKDLQKAGLIQKGCEQSNRNGPKTQPYTLTEKGQHMRSKFTHYLHVLNAD
jgi:DNA-binding PadR family transcriptional regulator